MTEPRTPPGLIPTRIKIWCDRCGTVREVPDIDVPWWCRHGDPFGPTAAREMQSLPSWHPLAAARQRERLEGKRS